MGEIAGAATDLSYAERLQRLTAAGIALWDTCHAAERPGALDQSIVSGSVMANDFTGFLMAHPGIRGIFHNGATSAQLYRRLVLPVLPHELAAIPRTTLPSTSPAHAGVPAMEKLEMWRSALAEYVRT